MSLKIYLSKASNTWLRFACLAICCSWVTGLAAQQEETQHSAAQTPRIVVLPATTTWKFGVRVTGVGTTTNAKVTFPLPTQWPEQDIKVIQIDDSKNTRGARIKKIGRNGSQMFFKIPRLSNGETAEVFVTFQIDKKESKAPEETDQFRFAKKLTSRTLRDSLSPSPFIESNHEKIKEIAGTIPIDESAPAWQQVETIYTWVRENVEYKFDLKIQSCLTALETGHGDCEELSSLFVALCRARKIPARAVWIPEHTYPEFYLEDAEGKGHWFPCQCAGSYAFGHMPEAKPILQKGDKFKVSGHAKPLRYIQPTMEAYGSSPRWEWLMTQVENDE